MLLHKEKVVDRVRCMMWSMYALQDDALKHKPVHSTAVTKDAFHSTWQGKVARLVVEPRQPSCTSALLPPLWYRCTLSALCRCPAGLLAVHAAPLLTLLLSHMAYLL